MTTMLDLKKLVAETPLRTARGRASNGATPIAFKVKLSPEHLAKLERLSAPRGVSLATIVRELIEAAS